MRKISVYLLLLIGLFSSISIGSANSVAYIYSTDSLSANAYKSLLDPAGYTTDLILSSNTLSADFSNYDIIIIGSDTGDLSTSDVDVNKISSSGKKVIGLGEGGYAFFGKLGLSTGFGNGWHGSNNSIYAVDTTHTIFNIPNLINIPSNNIIQLYSSTGHVGIFLPSIPSNVIALGREEVDNNHYPLTFESSRYLLWGFTASPTAMTQTGKNLFINIVNFLAPQRSRSYTFQTTDNSVQVTVDGTLHNSPFTVSWTDGTTHSISVPSSQIIVPGQSRYVYTAWSGMSTSTSPSISITAGASTSGTYSANYKKQYFMSVNTDPSALTSISGEGWYDSGTTATTGTAPGTSGPYTFSTWKIDGSPASGNPVSVHMTAPHTAIAVYQASVMSSTGQGRVDFETTTGTFQDLVAVNPIEIQENPPPDAYLLYGLFRFNITNVPKGGSVTLTLTFPANLPPNTMYLKYGTNHTPHYYYMIPVINGNKLTITLTDGGDGDDDLVANGKIKDDGGPATVTDIRPTEIIDNMSGIPVVNESTVNILAEDYMNFSAGDLYKITITRVVDGVEEFNKSGTLPGLAKETIKLDWTPQTTGDYVLRSEAGTIAGSKTVMVINQKVIQPLPEIATIALVSIGILGLFGLERRRRNG